MAQLNINLTTEFQENLDKLIRLRGFTSKSEAVRIAVWEAVERETAQKTKVDWRTLLGWAKQFPENPQAKPIADDDLWEKGYLGR
jgi:Arc/MetJ-type ribon-helix-helix transcriptional regulator